MPDFWRLLWDQDVHTVIILDLKVYQNGNQIKTVIILDLNVYQNGNQIKTAIILDLNAYQNAHFRWSCFQM